MKIICPVKREFPFKHGITEKKEKNRNRKGDARP